MEKPNALTRSALRIVIISIACFGGYLFSQSVIFGKDLTQGTLTVGIVCSFLVGVSFHFINRKKEKQAAEKKKNDSVIDQE